MKMISSLLCVFALLFVGVCNAETKTKFYENGQKSSEINYKDDEWHGLATWWHKNGQKGMEANYKDDMQHGLITLWYENGQKMSEINCVDDKAMNASSWLPDGSECPETTLVDGNGLSVLYDENGQKLYEMEYKDDKRHGLATYFTADGKVKTQIMWKDGEKVERIKNKSLVL